MLDNTVKQEMKEIRNETQELGTQQILKTPAIFKTNDTMKWVGTR